MKKIFLILVLALVSCGGSDDDEPIVKNIFNDTSWTADDEIASIIYGNGCTTTIEFISDSECQKIDYIPNGVFSGTTVEQGTYTFNDNNVSWIVDGREVTGEVSGCVLTSSLRRSISSATLGPILSS